jgi:hypothetical protein
MVQLGAGVKIAMAGWATAQQATELAPVKCLEARLGKQLMWAQFIPVELKLMIRPGVGGPTAMVSWVMAPQALTDFPPLKSPAVRLGNQFLLVDFTAAG